MDIKNYNDIEALALSGEDIFIEIVKDMNSLIEKDFQELKEIARNNGLSEPNENNKLSANSFWKRMLNSLESNSEKFTVDTYGLEDFNIKNIYEGKKRIDELNELEFKGLDF